MLSGSFPYCVQPLYWIALYFLLPSITCSILLEPFLSCYNKATSTLFLRSFSFSLPVLSSELIYTLYIRYIFMFLFQYSTISFANVSRLDINRSIMYFFVYSFDTPEVKLSLHSWDLLVKVLLMCIWKAAVLAAKGVMSMM